MLHVQSFLLNTSCAFFFQTFIFLITQAILHHLAAPTHYLLFYHNNSIQPSIQLGSDTNLIDGWRHRKIYKTPNTKHKTQCVLRHNTNILYSIHCSWYMMPLFIEVLRHFWKHPKWPINNYLHSSGNYYSRYKLLENTFNRHTLNLNLII